MIPFEGEERPPPKKARRGGGGCGLVRPGRARGRGRGGEVGPLPPHPVPPPLPPPGPAPPPVVGPDIVIPPEEVLDVAIPPEQDRVVKRKAEPNIWFPALDGANICYKDYKGYRNYTISCGICPGT